MIHTVVTNEIDERAALFALGALSQHEARSFEDHLREGCETCRDALREFESIVGNLHWAAPRAVPGSETRSRLMERVSDLERDNGRPKPANPQVDLPEFLTIRAEEGGWECAGDGVQVKRLFVDEARSTVTSLFKLAPGARCEGHRHAGSEECYVLEGDFRVNDEVLGPGDYHCAMPGSVDETLSTVAGATILIVGPMENLPI